MFQLTSTLIKPEELVKQCRRQDAGGYVSFEGWVRDHNEGKRVLSLAYEAYESMALKQGNRIIADAKDRFDIKEAYCVHRTGHLGLEDMAVWVGVSAAHRGPAFEACQFIINNIKVDVPIWKKEFYENGDSGWVNCEGCARHAHPHSE